MRARKTIFYYLQTLLYKAGIALTAFALISFVITLSLNWYTITTTNEQGVRETRTIGTLGTREAYQAADPEAIIQDEDRPFPLIPTLLLLAGIAITTRGGRPSTDFERLWAVLKLNRKIKLEKLTNETSLSRNYIFDKLPDINLQRGTSFYYDGEFDVVFDDDVTVDWPLNIKCKNCGATTCETVKILLGQETLSCPYCSHPVEDAEFEQYLANWNQQRRQQRRSLIPFKI